MTQQVKAAPIQMDAAPAPKDHRLERAAHQIAEAAIAGAALITLPELFNTGYEYAERNYAAAEPIDGDTVHWMQAQAKRYHVYLAGTLLLCEGGEIYNSALLIAPDGQMWRYDKNYPWAYERAYFRGRPNITIAETELGRLGMMICWDAAHPDLWEAYAGKVDGMIILSCPPKMSAPDMVFPDGKRVEMKHLSLLYRSIYTEEEHFPGKDMDEHAAWLGVPVVASAAAGNLCLTPPRSAVSVGALIAARPDLWKYFSRREDISLQVGFDRQTKVINGAGEVLARVQNDGDGFTIADVSFQPAPKPNRPQPKMRTAGWVYFVSDQFSAWMLEGQYQRGKQLAQAQMPHSTDAVEMPAKSLEMDY